MVFVTSLLEIWSLVHEYFGTLICLKIILGHVCVTNFSTEKVWKVKTLFCIAMKMMIGELISFLRLQIYRLSNLWKGVKLVEIVLHRMNIHVLHKCTP